MKSKSLMSDLKYNIIKNKDNKNGIYRQNSRVSVYFNELGRAIQSARFSPYNDNKGSTTTQRHTDIKEYGVPCIHRRYPFLNTI